jgi:hypothetical protein
MVITGARQGDSAGCFARSAACNGCFFFAGLLQRPSTVPVIHKTAC